MAQQKQKGGKTLVQIQAGRNPKSGKKARASQARTKANEDSQRRAALRRKAKGFQYMTAADHQILRGQ